MADQLPPHVRRPMLHDRGFNDRAVMPYGLTTVEVRAALEGIYDFLHDLNAFLVSRGYDRLEEIILGNSLSGFISELVVKGIGANSRTLVRNGKIGGHPDLIPRGTYPGDSVLRGEEGIEVKTSIQAAGWQGHNPEKSWIMVVQYAVDASLEPSEMSRPIEILKVMCALLEESDWSFSGRAGASRRTPTASILKSGTTKLHANAVYEHPHYVRNLNRMREQLDRLHLSPEDFEQQELYAEE
jgi:hypothetical protein